jgi:hypothetical protein
MDSVREAMQSKRGMRVKRLLKATAVALPLSFSAVVPQYGAFAQESGLPSAEPQAVAERQRKLSELIVRAIPASRIPEIYAELRYAVRELYLPAMRDMLNDPEAAKLDPEGMRKLALVVPLLDYGVRAAQELDPVSAGFREALVTDIAGLQAKYASDEQIRFMGELLDIAATRKAFNAVYALSRFITGYNQEDVRASREMMTAMGKWKFDSQSNPFLQKDKALPSREKVAKAEAIMTDLMRVSRVDEIVSEVVGFLRNVVLEVDSLKPEEIESVRAGLEQFEFYYNLLKPMAVGAAPSGMAAMMTEEQLRQYHLMILSPVMAKSFNLLHGFVREATSFTKQDIKEFRMLAEKGEAAKESWENNPEVQARMNAEWEALGNKWRERVMGTLSPDTRQGLENAVAAFNAMVAEEAAKKEEDEDGDAVPDLAPIGPLLQPRQL